MIINKKQKNRENLYLKFRGPDNPEKYGKWATKLFEDKIKRYNEIWEPYCDGDIKLLDVSIQEPYGYRKCFNIFIKDKIIRRWKKNGLLRKPPNQRGTAKEIKLSRKDRRKWNTFQFDKLQGKQVKEYDFSISPHWALIYLTNGAHRIELDSRWDTNQDDGNLHEIDFDYFFHKLNDEGQVEEVNLKGCENRKEVIKKIGTSTWEDKFNNLGSKVNLWYFDHEDKEDTNRDHAEVFIHSNDNLSDIQKVHSIETPINTFARSLSDWNAFDTNTVFKPIYETWDTKKSYNIDSPYQYILKTLTIFKKGFVDTSITYIDGFMRDEVLSDSEIENYKELITFSLNLYNKCRKENPQVFTKSIPKAFEFFVLTSMFKETNLTNNKKYFNLLDEDKFIKDMSIVIPNLLKESKQKYNDGSGSFYSTRRSASTGTELKKLIGMILYQLAKLGSICCLDTKRNISDTDKSTQSPICEITGKQVPMSELEFHHWYVEYSNGGISNVDNCKPILKEYNQLKNNKKICSTSDFIQYLKKEGKEVHKRWSNEELKLLKENENTKEHKFSFGLIKDTNVKQKGFDIC